MNLLVRTLFMAGNVNEFSAREVCNVDLHHSGVKTTKIDLIHVAQEEREAILRKLNPKTEI